MVAGAVSCSASWAMQATPRWGGPGAAARHFMPRGGRDTGFFDNDNLGSPGSRRQQPLCGLAVDLVRPRFERRRKTPEGGVEHRPHQDSEHSALELVVDRELDVAFVLTRRHEAPAVLHAP